MNNNGSKNDILVLNQNVSGMNKFLFSHLKKNWKIHSYDVPYPRRFWYQAALKTLNPDIKIWRQKHFTEHMRLMGSVASFRLRSEKAQNIAAKQSNLAEIIFQISGSFNGINGSAKPGALFLSFTTLLAYNEWRPWANFETEHEFNEWFELEKELYQSLQINLCTNDYVRQCLIRDYGVKPERTAVIGYGVNFENLPDFQKKRGSKKILFVGYDFERKGGIQVLKAFQKVRQVVPDAILQIVGPAFLPVEPTPQGVEFYGTIQDRTKVAEFFKEAQFFIMPSICEPFGLVLLEAMAYRNPCIGSTNNAMAEIIDDQKTGYTVPHDDIDALADRMITLLKNPDRCLEMGEAAFQRIKDNFTWELTTAKISREFKKMIELQR